MQRWIFTLLVLLLVACGDQSTEHNSMAADSGNPEGAASTAVLSADNPLLQPSPLLLQAPPFDRIQPGHFLPAFEEGMRQQLAEVRAIADNPAPPDFVNTIEALERSGALLSRVSKVFWNLVAANGNEELSAIEAEIAPRLARHDDDILLDAALFERVSSLYQQREALALDAESAWLLERHHLAFVRAGAELDQDAQGRLRLINAREAELTTAFDDNLLKDTERSTVFVPDADALAGLDQSTLATAAAAARALGREGGHALTLQAPSSQPVLAQLQERPLRQLVFEAATNRGNNGNEYDNQAIISELARLRAERAALLGHADHASYVLADQMAGTPARVQAMLGELTPRIRARAEAEAEALRALARADGEDIELEPWDWAYYAERQRRAEHELDEAMLKPYLELERVLQQGVFGMAQALYGITLHERADLPVYHPDVRVFEVREADGSLLGLFYADYYARSGKQGGAWMDSFVDQSSLLGTQAVVVNVMNIARPPSGQPTLLSFDEVITLFHEFGHALHGLFSAVRYPSLSGTNVPRDYVEFPSQFHEDFAFEPSLLAAYARHHQSGEALPQPMLQRLLDSRHHGQGFAAFEYLAAALLDLRWHSLPHGAADVRDVIGFEFNALKAEGVAWLLIPPRYRSTYFAHVWSGGYDAGYYAYLWSEVLAADAFAAMQQEGGMTPENGRRFREQVLSRGLSTPAMAQYVAYRGAEPAIDALLRRRGLQDTAR